MKSESCRRIWIMYQRQAPYLPLAIANTARELSAMTGESIGNIRSTANKIHAGKIKNGRFAYVEVDE